VCQQSQTGDEKRQAISFGAKKRENSVMPRLYVTFADVCACAVPWIEASRVLLVTTAER
jgi:hypothetical protein